MSENPKILFTPSLSELNETIIPKLKEMISKLDKDLIQSISKTMSKLKQKLLIIFTLKNICITTTRRFNCKKSEIFVSFCTNKRKC